MSEMSDRLKFRVDKESGALRSVGAPPHGVVGMWCDGDAAGFLVSPTWDPESATAHPGANIAFLGPQEMESPRLTVAEAVEGCPGPKEAAALWVMAEETLVQVTGKFARMGKFDYIRGHIDHFEQLAEALGDRFGYEEVEPDES